MDRGNESLIANLGHMLNMAAVLADTKKNVQKSFSKEPVDRFSR